MEDIQNQSLTSDEIAPSADIDYELRVQETFRDETGIFHYAKIYVRTTPNAATQSSHPKPEQVQQDSPWRPMSEPATFDCPLILTNGLDEYELAVWYTPDSDTTLPTFHLQNHDTPGFQVEEAVAWAYAPTYSPPAVPGQVWRPIESLRKS